MKTFLVLLVLHLENRIPITRDDTPRRSIAITLLWAKQPSIPRGSKRRVCQTRPQGRNGYGDGQTHARDSHRKKTAELLQQFNGPLRFGKHSPICVQFIRETSETQEQFFSVFENDRRY